MKKIYVLLYHESESKTTVCSNYCFKSKEDAENWAKENKASIFDKFTVEETTVYKELI